MLQDVSKVQVFLLLVLAVSVSGCSSLQDLDQEDSYSQFVFEVSSEDPRDVRTVARELRNRFSVFVGSFDLDYEVNDSRIIVDVAPSKQTDITETGRDVEKYYRNSSWLEKRKILGQAPENDIEAWIPVEIYSNLTLEEIHSVESVSSGLKIDDEMYQEGEKLTVEDTELEVLKTGRLPKIRIKLFNKGQIFFEEVQDLPLANDSVYYSGVEVEYGGEPREIYQYVIENLNSYPEFDPEDYSPREYPAPLITPETKINFYRDGEKFAEEKIDKDDRDMMHSIPVSANSSQEAREKAYQLAREIVFSPLPAEVELVDYREINETRVFMD